jgi:SAM-dependent methyltransferase
MSSEETQKKLKEYFSEKLREFGATPKGVDYNGPDAQERRFAQLVKIIDPIRPFSVIDYGSGYGAMFDFLNKTDWQFEYYGIDLIEDMVLAGRNAHQDYHNAQFTTNVAEVPRVDYLMAGAIFNIKLDESYEDWQGFVTHTLTHMNSLCTKGFSFNMLTKYSDVDRMTIYMTSLFWCARSCSCHADYPGAASFGDSL